MWENVTDEDSLEFLFNFSHFKWVFIIAILWNGFQETFQINIVTTCDWIK